MQHFNFISIKLSLYLILGILIGFYTEPQLYPLFFVLLILLIVLGFLHKKQSRNGFPFFGSIAALIVIILGVCIVSISNPKNIPLHYINHQTESINTWHITINEVLKPSSYSNRYIVKVKNLNNKPAVGKLLLRIANDTSNNNLNVDDELVFFATAKTVIKPLNPNGFDYQKFLKKKGIYHQLKPRENKFIKLPNPSKTVFGYASNFRNHIITKLKEEDFGSEELAVIQALLLGQRNDISEETYTSYKNAGAVHILAVSGLHIGILLLLLQFLLKPLELLPRGKTIKLIVIVFLLWGFAFIAGLSASIIRAVCMFSFIAYAMYLNRPTNTFNIIALSLFFILLIEPLFLFQVGFQMSYAAVFSIAWIYPKLQRFWYPENNFLRKVWQLLSVSVAAQLGVLPISLFYFHQFPALFFIANLIVVPFLGALLGLGILVLVLAVLNTLPQVLVLCYNFLIKTMNWVIKFVGKQEAFVFQDIPFDGLQLVLGYAIVLGLLKVLLKHKFKNLAFLLVSIIAFQGWTLYKEYQASSKEQLLLTHEIAHTMLLKQEGKHLEIFGKPSNFSKRIIQDYTIAERIDTISYATLKNNYLIAHKKLYIMDSLAIYPPVIQLDYLVLTQSPKLNLERLLDSIQPKKLIVDGSNYKSYIANWEATCIKRKLPFHYTGEKGAYYFK